VGGGRQEDEEAGARRARRRELGGPGEGKRKMRKKKRLGQVLATQVRPKTKRRKEMNFLKLHFLCIS
jgi:hypothetical protein